jgi:hypothetical protein
MNLFKDYFADYVDEFQLTSLQNGEIVRFTVNKENRELIVVLSLSELVDYSVFESAEKSIKNSMGLSRVSVKPRYLSSLFETAYFPSIIDLFKKQNPAANGFFDNAVVEYNEPVLRILLRKGGIDILKIKKLMPIFSA